MTAYTDFHYSPTGSGVISGAQVLEQTEQGINGLGQYVQDNVSGAIDTANQALTIAQTADSNATLALNTANSFASAISAANNTANNALTTAQSAQNTANTASSLAITANNNANTALNAANTATSNVATLTGTVNSLGNRMTTAENAISTNAGNITTLQTNLQTTNNNVTAAANAASSAQATATSAQSTATLARNQAYVLRYTGTTITGGGTIAYADIDNTDNIKAGDKIIDISGAIYDIASVDTANETVTVSASEIINLAVLPDLFNSANTWSANNTFSAGAYFYNSDSTAATSTLNLRNSKVTKGGTSDNGSQIIQFLDKDNKFLSQVTTTKALSGTTQLLFTLGNIDSNNNSITGGITFSLAIDGTKQFIPGSNNTHNLGNNSYKWKTLNGVNPGALSLPDSSNVINIDTENWVYDGATSNSWTATVDCWVTVYSNQCELLILKDETLKIGAVSQRNGSYTNYVFIPVCKGDVVILIANNVGVNGITVKAYQMLGNVN